MTARHYAFDILQITTQPGEDAKEVLSQYIAELARHGHSMAVVQSAPTNSAIANSLMQRDHARKCDGCHQTIRIYNIADGTMTIFSDFGEEHQCTRRQMNVLSLMQR